MFDTHAARLYTRISGCVLHRSSHCCSAQGFYITCRIRYHLLVEKIMTNLSDRHKNIRAGSTMSYYSGRPISQYAIGQEVDYRSRHTCTHVR